MGGSGFGFGRALVPRARSPPLVPMRVRAFSGLGGGARAVLSGRFGVSELSVKYHYSHRFSTNSVRRESERRSPLVESYHVRF